MTQGHETVRHQRLAKACAQVVARIGARAEAMSVEFFATNLTHNKVLQAGLIGTDVRYFVGPTLTSNEVRFSLPMKRMFGARASYNF